MITEGAPNSAERKAWIERENQKQAIDLVRRTEQNYQDAIKSHERARQVMCAAAMDTQEAYRAALKVGLTPSQIQAVRDNL